MDPHHKYLSHHRQSLRPGSGTAMTSMLASRYGIQLGGSSTSGKRGSTSTGSLGSSPIRSRSNSTSRFKAAAAVAVAAATGNKQFGNSSSYHRPSISPASFNLRSSTASSSSTSTSGANNLSSSALSSSTTNSISGVGSAAAQGVGAGISSTVVSFMKKFVNKATTNSNSNDSIDQSFEQYQKQQQQQQQQRPTNSASVSSAQSPTKYLFSAITGSNSVGGQTTDTGYSSSNVDSPVTTPTMMMMSQTNSTMSNTNSSSLPLVPGSSSSSSTYATNANLSSQTNNNVPIMPNTKCSPTDSLNSISTIHHQQQYGSNTPTLSNTTTTTVSRPSSAASSVLNSNTNSNISSGASSSSVASSVRNGPIFSKIRAKVASTFQQQLQQQPVQEIQSPSTTLSSYPRSSMAMDGHQDLMMMNNNDLSKVRSGSISSITGGGGGGGNVGTPVGMTSGSPTVATTSTLINNSSTTATATSGSTQRAPMLSMISSQSSSLTNEQLTAHLTDEERQILQKVWQKEEEFREIALKNFNKNMSTAVEIMAPEDTATVGASTTNQIPPGTTNQQAGLGTGGTPASGSVSHLSTNLLDPVAAAVHRRRSSAIMSADAEGFCRICRKIIMKNETSHRCSNCQELVCDDCSSYSSREDTKYWMCSFCRRRGSHLVLVTTGSGSTSTTTSSSTIVPSNMSGTTTTTNSMDSQQNQKRQKLSLNVTNNNNNNNQTSQSNEATCTNQQRFLSTTATPLNVLNTKRKLSFQELQRPQSAFDQYGQSQSQQQNPQNQQQQQQQPPQQQQNRQSSLDLNLSKPLLMNANNLVQQEMPKFSRNLPQIPTNATTTMAANLQQTNVIIKQNNNNNINNNNLQTNSNQDTNRTRIYSLSDDEELWNDDEDDDDDEDGDDVILKDEQGLLDQQSRYFDPQAQQQQQHPSHYGTLQTVPVEQLKLQRCNQQQQKKKKKKVNNHQLPHSSAQQAYNSDDELLANGYGGSANHHEPPSKSSSSIQQQYCSTPPITITSLDDPEIQPITNQKDPTNSFQQPQQQPQQPSRSLPSHPSTYSQQPQVLPTNNITGAGVSYQQCQNKQPKVLPPTVIPKIISVQSSSSSGSAMKQPPPGAITATHWWRLTNKARSLCRANGGPEAFYGTRKQLSSESSDFSDGFKYSPPQESLTPSSEYSRSPRESADSDMLGLQCYSSRGNIPSVMVGDTVDAGIMGGGGGIGGSGGGAFLSTTDCYLRRGSTGRALPKIPISGSSMLDLPHSRKNSQQSLDIPTEQPRRASAPESGDPIRIVIDECTDLSASHLELAASTIGALDHSVQMSTLQGSSIHHHQTPGPSIIQVPNPTTLQQRMRYQLSRAASITTHYERVVLQRDKSDQSTRTRGFSLAITGGKLCENDGMLYAYVTWIKPGGQADSHLLKSGDKILEWSGKSLVNCSHEQVCNIMDTSGDMVELIVESMVRNDQPAKRRHSLAAQSQQQKFKTQQPSPTPLSMTSKTDSVSNISSTSGGTSSATVCARPSSAAALISTATTTTTTGSLSSIPSISSTSNIGNTNQSSGSLRRRLPQIPTHQTSTSNSSSSMSVASNLLSDAQIFLQVTVDANIRQLSVMIIQAKGLERHPIYAQNPGFEAYAQLRLLPEMGFKICQTELSRTFDWNETLIYHQFPLERIEKITLDLSVWCTTPSTYIPGGGGSKSPRITISGLSSLPPDHQLASTRIPLRSALLMHISEWWPLIPCNVLDNVTLSSLSFQKIATSQSSLAESSLGGQTTTSASMAPTVFFQKAPSMDHIGGEDSNALLSDQMMRIMMTSRSTPGSRRNSNRLDQNDGDALSFNTLNQSTMMTTSMSARNSPNNLMKTSPTPPPVSASWFQRYRSSPSRASAASTVSSSTGRHSLDESYSITNSARSGGHSGPPSISSRFTSLRSTPNRHSIGNLYQIGPSASGVQHRQSNAQQQLSAIENVANRRKSSSALTQGSRNKLFVPGSRGYNPMGQTDSYQYLLEQTEGIPHRSNSEIGYQSDQESELDTSDDDEDFDNLLKDSSYTLDSLDTRDRNISNQIKSQENDKQKDSGNNNNNNNNNSSNKIPERNMPDKNLLSIDVHGSRYSVNTASDFRTPSHDEDYEDDSSQNGSLTIPVCQERRPSFLRRLVPSAAETVMNMVMGGPGSNAQPSDEILHPNTEGGSIEHPKRTVVVVGEIKLGFIMTKGFLEIEVIAARNLPDSTFGPHPPDTYVKTYLVDHGRQLYKRKTRVIPGDKNPHYRQTLKYDASIIYGRTLLVSVWEKQRRKRTFDANTPIGSVEINVNQLQLHKLTIRWFKLRSLVEQQQQQQQSNENHSEMTHTTPHTNTDTLNADHLGQELSKKQDPGTTTMMQQQSKVLGD